MRTPCLKMLCNVAQFLPRQATSLAFFLFVSTGFPTGLCHRQDRDGVL